jgi:hypothetical protein
MPQYQSSDNHEPLDICRSALYRVGEEPSTTWLNAAVVVKTDSDAKSITNLLSTAG